MDRYQKILMIIFIMVFVVAMVLLALGIKSDIDSVEETIERCKSKGWDGAKFKSGFGSEMICSNISQAEKDGRGDLG